MLKAARRLTRYASFSVPRRAMARKLSTETITICGPPELQGYTGISRGPMMGLTENLADTYRDSGSACLDFFFHIVPETTNSSRVKELAQKAWEEDALTTLKLIFQLRGIRGTGKSDKAHFYDAACWLYDNHPKTLTANLGKVAPVGYFKDLLELVQRIVEGEELTNKRLKMKKQWDMTFPRPAKPGEVSDAWKLKTRLSSEYGITGRVDEDKISELRKDKRLRLASRVLDKLSGGGDFVAIYASAAQIFADALLKDLEAYKSDGEKARLTLAAKWCPSLDSSYDKQTLLCEAIACKVFPKSSEPEYADLTQEHYAYRVRDKLRKEVLVPLRKALQLPEVYMTAKKWDELPYKRVASIAMKNYTNLFMVHDKERFEEYLEDVKAGRAKIASGALLPHDILMDAVKGTEAERATAELQWKGMVDELREKGSLQNAVSICDVSGSMAGTPMEVAIALGLLTSELSDVPWKGRLITFSNEPAFHEIKGETLAEKYRFTENMPWAMNTDFQKVFDRILEQAQKHQVPPEKMVKRLFVYSDMEFDAARGSVGGYCYSYRFGTTKKTNAWETDYMAIKRKFKEAGYEEPPQIVFWNLRDSQSVPVCQNETGVAMVSGFSKNLLEMFLDNDGTIDPMIILRQAISDKIYEDMVVVD